MGTSIGLEISTNAIRVVALRQRFRKMRLVAFGEERLEAGANSEEVASTIQRLFARLPARSKEVIVHLEGASVRHFVLETPLLSQAELELYVRQRCLELVPSHFEAQQLICSFQVLGQAEEKLRLLVVYCHAHAAQERVRLLEMAGLQPARIGSVLDLANAFAFEIENFFDKTILFLVLRPQSFLLFNTQKGRSTFLHHGPNNLQQGDWRREIAKTLALFQREQTAASDQLLVVNTEACLEDFSLDAIAGITVQHGKPLVGLLAQNEILPPQYSLAAGLALKGLFPLLNTIDLLPQETAVACKQQRQKTRALRVMLVAGAASMFLLLLLQFTNMVMQRRLATAQERALVIEADLRNFAELEKKQEQFERAWRDLRGLAAQRSHEAKRLCELSQLLPEGVWLEEMTRATAQAKAGANPTPEQQLELRGWALQQSDLALLLERFEQTRLFREVQLRASASVTAEEVMRRSRLRALPLVAFTVVGIWP